MTKPICRILPKRIISDIVAPDMKEMTALINRCQQLCAQGGSKEEIVSFLRSQGCSKAESIMAVVKIFRIGLAEGNKIVHLSQTWADTRARDEQVHDSFLDALESKCGNQ
jgi:hypothetical protein